MKRIMLVAVVSVLVCPGSAWADSGSISNVFAVSADQVSATYTATSTTCSDIGFCGWYPYAVQSPASQACTPYADGDGRLTMVGTYQDDSGTQVNTDTFFPSGLPVRICLYIRSPDETHHLVAETVYGTPATTPPPTTTPPPPPAAVRPLSVNEAKGLLKGVLKGRYHTHFTRRHGTFTRSCHRYTTQKVRCRVVWNYKTYRYSGTVTMRNDPDDPANSFLYRINVKRKRVHAPHRQSVSHGGGGSGCDPNYSGCLSPNASDYDCAGGSGDGPRYTGAVRVLGNDHYDLDRDGDGVACDDPSAASAQTRGGAEAARAHRAREMNALRSAARLSRRE